MSQYPSPYPPPPYAPPTIDFSQYQPAGQDLLGPARRAGTLVLVIGAMISLLGLCNVGQSVLLSPEVWAEQQAQMRGAGMPESPLTFELARLLSGIMGGLTLLTGLLLVANGIYVRRGSAGAVTLGMVLTAGLALLVGGLMALVILGAFIVPAFAAVACVFAVPLGLLIWAFVWLLAAARSRGQVVAAQQQYQAQFYQYQQQQQAYLHAGAYGMQYPPQGYGYPTPAPQQSVQPQLPPQEQQSGQLPATPWGAPIPPRQVENERPQPPDSNAPPPPV